LDQGCDYPVRVQMGSFRYNSLGLECVARADCQKEVEYIQAAPADEAVADDLLGTKSTPGLFSCEPLWITLMSPLRMCWLSTQSTLRERGEC
jgi:hypothetical protein